MAVKRPKYGDRLRWADHVFVVGLQRTGKTTFVKELVATARRVVYFDPKGDYIENGKSIAPMDLEDDEILDGDRVRLAIQAGRDPDVELADEFRYVVRRLREAKEKGGVVLVADELNLYSDKVDGPLRRLMSNGHHDNIVSVLISQRGVDVPLGCRALATKVYSFKQKHPRDLERLAEEFGEDFAAEARDWKAHQPPAAWEQERFYE